MTAFAVPARSRGSGAVLPALGWSLGFAGVAGLAALYTDRLRGGLAFFAVAWPLEILTGRPVPDAAHAAVSFVLVFLFSFVLLYLREAAQEELDYARFPVAASVFAILLLLECVYLTVGEMPRHRFGEFARGYYLPWHLATLALTAVYVLSTPVRKFRAVRRLFWLAVFVLCLAVLFPWTDSL